MALSFEPEVVLTWDAVTSPEIYSKMAGSRGSLIERNFAMVTKLGVDVTTYIHDPGRHWMDLLLDDWCKHLGMKRKEWDTSPGGGSRWISRKPFKGIDNVKKYLPEYLEEGKLQKETSLGLEIFRAYASYSASRIILVSDDIAYNGGLIFPKQFLKKYLFLGLRRIYEPLKDSGIKCFFHSDGNLGNILLELVNEVEIDGLNPIESLAGMDPVKIRAEFGRLLLAGGIDTSYLLPFGTPGDVERQVSRILSNLSPQGSYFVGSSNELHTAVPLDNAKAMYNAAPSFTRF